jgi:hypothetical protein
MRKAIALLILVLLTLVSAVGYIVVHGKILAGERLIADGQEQFDKEQINLDEGKAKLEAGKQKNAAGKEQYKKARGNLFLRLADRLFKGGKGFRDAKEQLAGGDRRVAKGEDKVKAGQDRLDAGELKLLRGRALVRQARRVRIACALGAALFGSLSLVLGIRWRRSLARTLKHADA